MFSRCVKCAALTVALAFAAPASGAGTFRYASSGDILTMDPHAANEALTNGMKDNVYEGLVHRSWDLSIEPGLAVSWTRPDLSTWRFRLRPGVTFHDGTPLTADDVVFSLRRSKHKNALMAGSLADVKDARKVDDLTVDLLTDGPRPSLLLSLHQLFVMSRRWCEEHGTTEPSLGLDQETYATRHANGTGPFMLVEHVPDTRTVLVPNPRWWDDAHKEHDLARAEFRPVANAATRVAALLSGELDLAYPVPLQDIPRVNGTPGFKVLQAPELRVVYLGFDQWRDELLDMPGSGKNPFKDVRVRRAFYQSIDADALHRKVMRGVSLPTGLMVAKGVAGWDEALATRYPFDPTAAKKLLAEAGYPDGFPVTLDCPNDRYVNDEALCQAVVAMLGRVSVKVTLNAQTKSRWSDKIGRRQNNNTSFFMNGWTPVTYDAHNALVNVMTMRGESAGQYNSGRYSNPKVEELTAAIATEADPRRRTELIREALRVHRDDFGHIPLHQPMLVWNVREGVDLKVQAADQVLLRYVKLRGRGVASRERAKDQK